MNLSPFTRFLLVGMANTLVGYSVIFVLERSVGLDRRLANAGGYLIGGTVSYLLNRRFAFRSDRAHRHALPSFVLAALFCFGVNLAVLEIGVAVLKLPSLLAQAAALCSYTLSFYAINRFHVFRAS